MTDDEAARACKDIYNGFWLKWRQRRLDRHSPEWDTLYGEVRILYERYSFPLARGMMKAFLEELEERVREREGR